MAERAKSLVVPLALAVAVCAGGCADEQEPLIILHAVAWPDEGECFIDGGSDVTMGRGTLDVRFGTPYLLGLALYNQLPPRDPNTSNSGTDNSEVQLRSADVTLRSDQAPELIDMLEAQDPALVDFNAPLATDSIPGDSRVGVGIEVISGAASESLRDGLGSLPDGARPVILADIVVKARRTGNSVGGVGEFESRTFTFPIQICEGCLMTCVSCENSSCPAASSGYVGGVCGNTQDLPWAPGGCGNPLEGGSGS